MFSPLFICKAPIIVDVAFVDVALKKPNVGVEVATTLPVESVERIEFKAVPERFNELIVEDELEINPFEKRTVIDVVGDK